MCKGKDLLMELYALLSLYSEKNNWFWLNRMEKPKVNEKGAFAIMSKKEKGIS